MANNVVLASDLALFDGDDCLKFDSNDQHYISIPIDGLPFSLSGENVTLQGGRTVAVIAEFGDSDNIVFINNGEYKVKWNLTAGGTKTQTITIHNSNSLVDVSVEYVGSDVSVVVNGVTSVISGAVLPSGYVRVFSRTSTILDNANGLIYSLSAGNSWYIKNGDFGSALLVDHSGNGNDGVLMGVTWWKRLKTGEPVHQYFNDVTLYKNQLPVTPVEFQNVIDVDLGVPPTNDPYWELYDENWLTVTVQSSGLASYNYRPNTMKLSLAMEL